MIDNIPASDIPASHISWKRIEEAQIRIIREALRLRYKKDNAYNRKMARYRKWYQNKKDLLASIENLYSLFYSISKEERPMAEEEIDKTIEELIADEAE
ncbi:hypothetical protein GLOIN_2v1765427 [Rhizophagus clarus]|uniref:Uncharacterized protein n=1 Tax=Rhizophagus clarus TaxID=94130 RepID=A0A8H3L6S7_9GLOM|nr:hypothetical protein GLOIN_2v1765427 [Rhizophagus clarus]